MKAAMAMAISRRILTYVAWSIARIAQEEALIAVGASGTLPSWDAAGLRGSQRRGCRHRSWGGDSAIRARWTASELRVLGSKRTSTSRSRGPAGVFLARLGTAKSSRGRRAAPPAGSGRRSRPLDVSKGTSHRSGKPGWAEAVSSASLLRWRCSAQQGSGRHRQACDPYRARRRDGQSREPKGGRCRARTW